MAFQLQQRTWSRRLFLEVLLAYAMLLLISQRAVNADEVPAFFLKIAKNIPRVGRSDKGDDFSLKSEKDIPRTERRYNDAELTKQQNDKWPTYEKKEYFTGLSKRRINYPPINAEDSWSWQHFPLAIEGPKELWRTLAGYSRDPSDDIDNEIWQRRKRTGEQSAYQRGN